MKHRVLPVIATLAVLGAAHGDGRPCQRCHLCFRRRHQAAGLHVRAQPPRRREVRGRPPRRQGSVRRVGQGRSRRQGGHPAEKAALGQQISALAKQLKDATNVVERKALIAEIHALVDQKKSAPTTADDVQTLRSDIHRLGRSIQHRTDTAAEDQQVADFVHTLLAQFAC